jgi:nucleoside-diphosphate-sugar epimerase
MPVRSIIVTGAEGPLARRAMPLLHRDPGVSVVGVGDPLPADLKRVLADADALVHLGWVDRGPREPITRHNVDATHQLLEAAENSALTSLVLLSSATVYGAWPDNPIPLTEEAPLRPNPGVTDAVHHAEAERLVAAWAAERPDVAVAVLRPATVMGRGVDSGLAQALSGRGTVRPVRSDPDRQFVHVDDLASAVALAAGARLDGVFNVAPSGSVSGEVVRELSSWRPSLPLPGLLGPVAVRWAWGLHLSTLAPWFLPLLEDPWVIASDRLQALGWVPQYTSEEAIVAGRPPSRWREMSPGRRQSVALAGSGVLAASVAAGIASAVARARRRVG